MAKPVRRGVKIWICCDGHSNYCQEFHVYLGKESTQPSRNGAIFDVVWNLLKKIQGKNHVVYFDNLFSSVVTAKFLYSKQFLMVGTVRSGRKYLPDEIQKPGKLGWGEFITFQSSRLSNLTCTVWKDTKEVRFISTLNRPDVMTKCLRRVGSRRIEVNTPSCASSYSRNYSAVDKYDRVYGSLGHGSNKVWKHLMWHFTNMAIANAWILFSETSTRPKSKYYDHMAFRHELATQLIGSYSSRKKGLSMRPNLEATVISNMAGHELVRMPVKRGKRCIAHSKYQSNKKKKKETIYGCFQCNSHFCHDCFCLAHCSK